MSTLEQATSTRIEDLGYERLPHRAAAVSAPSVSRGRPPLFRGTTAAVGNAPSTNWTTAAGLPVTRVAPVPPLSDAAYKD